MKYEDLKCEFCDGLGEREINVDGADCPQTCTFCNGTGIDEDMKKQFYTSLAPTLYEQHFKMLEALKNVMLLNAVARQHISDVFFQEIEQTIKDCEL